MTEYTRMAVFISVNFFSDVFCSEGDFCVTLRNMEIGGADPSVRNSTMFLLGKL